MNKRQSSGKGLSCRISLTGFEGACSKLISDLMYPQVRRGSPMPSIDLESLSLAELKSLEKDIAKAISGFGDRKKAEAMNALEEHAKALGFSLAELTGKKVRKARAGSGEARYRHPENPDVTWSGLGRRPAWFTVAIDDGKSADSMAV